jgi:hypothetical protein
VEVDLGVLARSHAVQNTDGDTATGLAGQLEGAEDRRVGRYGGELVVFELGLVLRRASDSPGVEEVVG